VRARLNTNSSFNTYLSRARVVAMPHAPAAAAKAAIYRKTKMCKFHYSGACARGSACAFAHAEEELEALPDLSRTKICRTLMTTGSCHDPDCKYAHAAGELREIPALDQDGDAYRKKTREDARANAQEALIPSYSMIVPVQAVFDATGSPIHMIQMPSFRSDSSIQSVDGSQTPLVMSYPFHGGMAMPFEPFDPSCWGQHALGELSTHDGSGTDTSDSDELISQPAEMTDGNESDNEQDDVHIMIKNTFLELRPNKTTLRRVSQSDACLARLAADGEIED